MFRYLECFFDPLKVFPRRHFLHTPPNFQGVVNPLLSLAFSLQGILYEKLSQASTLRSSARCIALYWLLNRSAGRPVKLEVCNGEVCQLANEEIIDLKKYENSKIMVNHVNYCMIGVQGQGGRQTTQSSHHEQRSVDA